MGEADYNAKSIDATLARIEAKLDIYGVTQNAHSIDIEELKKWRWKTVGGCGAIMVLIQFLTKIVSFKQL
jgi:hypothetical protein